MLYLLISLCLVLSDVVAFVHRYSSEIRARYRTRYYATAHVDPPFMLAVTNRRIRRSQNPCYSSRSVTLQSSAVSAFTELCDLLHVTPSNRLCLRTDDDGVRGVYLNDPPTVNKEDILLKIPLSYCLRDDEPPEWLIQRESQNDMSSDYYSTHQWPARLAASLLDLQLAPSATSYIDQGIQQWLSLLPELDILRASLPVHWSEDILTSTQCTALELAVDAAYFARAEAAQDLLTGLEQKDGSEVDRKELTSMCHEALDVVQTRCCKVEVASGDDTTTRTVRLLAPIFDMINHGSNNACNAYFQVEKDCLVVRAACDIPAFDQVLIDYGDSARPAWRCLVSYGFVPNTPSTTAELVVDGVQSEISEGSVPIALIEAAATAIKEESGGIAREADNEDQQKNLLTGAFAERIATQALATASQMLEEPGVSPSNEHETVSLQLAALLRKSQIDFLATWAKGLLEYSASISAPGS